MQPSSTAATADRPRLVAAQHHETPGLVPRDHLMLAHLGKQASGMLAWGGQGLGQSQAAGVS